jgi:two-component system, response regulator, stage 0 sporulation protein A
METNHGKLKYRTILADHNRDYLRLVADYLNETGQFLIEDFAFDGRQAYELTSCYKPDLLVLDLLMPVLDSFAVLEELITNGYHEDTKVVMTSAVTLDFVLNKAECYHVDYVFIKPFEKEVFKRRLIELMAHDSADNRVFGRPQPRASDIVTQHIKTVGITANIKGYHYLRDAILLVHQDFDLMSRLTSGLYVSVASKYNSTPQRVERAMRHAIETAWNRGNIKVLEDFFGYTILDTKGKPTNGEFIAMLADKLNTELKYVD